MSKPKTKPSGNWVEAGEKYDSKIYINLDTGEKVHIGTKLTSEEPEIYKGEPSARGYVGGLILKTILGRKK